MLSEDDWFFGEKVNKLDISILPFIRQFRIANSEWFDQQKEIKCLDKRVDEIDHATQLRLVPRDEYKFDISALHTRVNILSEQLGRKQDTIKTIRIDKEKGK